MGKVIGQHLGDEVVYVPAYSRLDWRGGHRHVDPVQSRKDALHQSRRSIENLLYD